ncbi:NAD(P)-dependent alcohol dehydrogenase [Oleiagrimonas sp. C23AA]|uniref:NAD(P)-dependent alcohol dehydrogenase n=1 Tax=Oleiagrimonas sp. C23AA TaxID=2719047 RepID=UPI0014208B5D|nr:NAD(P)-dependent alcohol dehydrogenase [Oleiagrimonas sp. C23AA]NII11940.1 NAD(P)-dependent alcohol dehydrogenase [Oleiagrimonas sp. C23AA]
MSNTPAYAAVSAGAELAAHAIERRQPGPHDVEIAIRYCGVCHSDIHQVRDEWGGSVFPMVPGHEIVGTVTRVGDKVEKWAQGDTVGVGCFVDSCRTCAACEDGEEQFCEKGMSATYNSFERHDDGTLDRSRPTYGGYATRIVVDENYVLRVPESIALERAAPLLCAGITTYSPLKLYQVGEGDTVAVVGLGGLGHMAVKIAKAMGASVTVLSHSPNKRDAALKLGADDFVATGEENAFDDHAGRFDVIIDTVSAGHDYNAYLGLLKRAGVMVLVGMPEPQLISAGSLILGRKRLAGSMIGGIAETQEMLDFCAEHDIGADVEVIPVQDINDAYERMMRGDVRYRFVIDTASFQAD